jgi:murein DD-endopeptidase MepM/ murein hydrolase activator NlpD
MQSVKIIMKPIEFTKRNAKKDTLSKTARLFPKSHLLIVSGLAGLLLATSAVTTYSAKEPERISKTVTLTLETSIPNDTDNNTALEPATTWHTETVKPGDNLSLLFNRAGLSDLVLQQFLSSNKNASQLVKIYPGQKIAFLINESKQLQQLRYQKTRLQQIEFVKTEEGFRDNQVVLEPDKHTAYREATIINSLFLAGTDVGMDEGLIMELANIFGWDIDFALDIRTNDSFKVLYEEHFINGEKIGSGPILAAEFTNQNKTYSAVRYTDTNGESNYYTPEGKSMRKAFLRTPVDFARISSHFNLQRKHPILNKIRAHKGTDYAAPTGTPIKAAGNGKIEFAGVKGGYGRTVIIRHGQTYKTLYAHMNKYGKGIKTGAKVSQGQIIGYVGKSGLATGPHLHYEFYQNGVVRNPVRVELPKAKSIAASSLKNFKEQTLPLVAQLQEFTNNTQLALRSTTNNQQ